VADRDDSFDLFRCATCGCQRIDRRRASDGDRYSAYYREASAQRLAGVFDRLWQWKRRSRGRMIRRHTSATARVCDIGCERGELLSVLKAAGCSVAGTQLSPAAAQFARDRYGIDVYVGELMDAPFHDEVFDVAIMLNVLEHLPDPDRYVAQVARMLASDGVFWLEVPNAGSLTARMCGKRWLHHDPDYHLWSLDKAALDRLLLRHGFVADRVSDFTWEHGPIGCVQSWLNFLPGPRNVVFDVVRDGFARTAGRRTLQAAHLVLATLLVPAALAVTALEGLIGNGQITLIRLRKTS
jgi:SAM-dependent methyltransferase